MDSKQIWMTVIISAVVAVISAGIVGFVASSPSVTFSPRDMRNESINNTCSDTDGGFNIYLRGTVSGILNGVPYSYIDYCINSTGLLNEYYCTGNASWSASAVGCPASYSCVSGACVLQGNNTLPDLIIQSISSLNLGASTSNKTNGTCDVKLTAFVKNIGQGSAGVSWTFLQADYSGGYKYTGPLSSGQTTSVASLFALYPGTHRALALADGTSIVRESNELNNAYNMTFYVSPCSNRTSTGAGDI